MRLAVLRRRCRLLLLVVASLCFAGQAGGQNQQHSDLAEDNRPPPPVPYLDAAGVAAGRARVQEKLQQVNIVQQDPASVARQQFDKLWGGRDRRRSDISDNKALLRACSVDVRRYCADIPMGEDRVRRCLQDHKYAPSCHCHRNRQAASCERKRFELFARARRPSDADTLWCTCCARAKRKGCA